MSYPAGYPGSAARIAQLAQLAEEHQRLPRRQRDQASLFEEPRPAGDELPERIGYREVRTDNGLRVGVEFFERSAGGERLIEAVDPLTAFPEKRKQTPWDQRRKERAKDKWYRRRECLRKRKAKLANAEWRDQREILLRALYETIEIFVHVSGQVYAWDWPPRSKRLRRPQRESLHEQHPDLFPAAADG